MSIFTAVLMTDPSGKPGGYDLQSFSENADLRFRVRIVDASWRAGIEYSV